MSTFSLPDLGEGLAEAELVSWHVAEGDRVVTDQPLLAVETEKAAVEIPSPQAGHIGKLLAKVGERVKVGAPLLEFEEGRHAESGTVMGQLAAAPKTSPAQPAIPVSTVSAPGSSTTAGVRASPAVRARARELAVDLSDVRPTGADNTITMADVEGAASRSKTAQGAANLRGARRTMAANMARAWREVAHATVQDDADIEGWRPGEDVTGRVVRALIAACEAEPALNSSFDAATLSLQKNDQIHLGLAIDGPDGLFVPVLRDVAHMSASELRQQIDDFKRGAQERSLAPADLRGATFSLSNFGSIAGQHATLIVMPPQVAILGVGRVVAHVVQMSNALTLHRILPLSLTFDHRAITGGMAARFLKAVIFDLEAAV